jgi:microcin C transport system permease protein
MTRYFLRRILLIIPTLFAIIAINFAIVQLAPGGPAQAIIAKLHQPGSTPGNSLYRGGENLDATTARLNAEFGFNQPPLTRFLHMLRGYLTFNLGNSLSSGAPVASLIWQRLPVSLSLGLWSTLIIYLISIPLGILKAARNGSTFDTATGTIIAAGYAIPGFLLAILLITLLGQGGILPLFPLRGLASPGAATWPLPARIADYAWHLVLPTIAMTAGGFATLTLLTKNAILEETQKLYVTTARAKGASEPRILRRHILPNAAILLAATLPAALTTILFTSALLVEIIFSLNGLGLLGFNAILTRDYPVMFGTLYIYTIIALTLRLLGDFLYALLDPRIDFDSRS